MATFVHPVRILWGDCDPAGIVYFPRYFDFFHQAMEAWFEGALSMPYADVITGRKIGFPAVHTEADFASPSAFGDRLDVRLTIERVGRTSVTFGYQVTEAGVPSRERVRGRTVCVVMDLDPASPGFRRAVEVPSDIRDGIDAWTAAP